MPPVTDSSAEPAGQPAVNDYDSFAEAYSAGNEVNLINAYYERPAILDLAGDVAGRRILDAGCGSGPLSAALRDRGAIVTGFDSSAEMLELARRRLGPDADLRVADLGRPAAVPRRRLRRRHRVPGAALPGGLDGAAGRAAARAAARRPADRVRRPSLRWPPAGPSRRRLLRDLPWSTEYESTAAAHADGLAPAAARDDQRLHRGRLPDSRHRRTAPRAGHPPRAAPRLDRGRAPGASCASCSSSWRPTNCRAPRAGLTTTTRSADGPATTAPSSGNCSPSPGESRFHPAERFK